MCVLFGAAYLCGWSGDRDQRETYRGVDMPGQVRTKTSTVEKLIIPVMGEVDLDPAATTVNDVRAKTAWDGEIVDGLVPQWAAVARTVWLVPPRKHEELHGHTLGKWVERAYRESRKGATVLAILPAKTGVGWFHNFVTRSAAFTFVQQKYELENWGPEAQLSVLWSADNKMIDKYQQASESRGLLVVNA